MHAAFCLPDMPEFHTPAIRDLDSFLFGECPRPLKTRSGIEFGTGTVYPELNFTLPAMHTTEQTMPEVRAQYAEMIEETCRRAVALDTPGLVVEFELLPELTRNPEWGAEITGLLAGALDRFAREDGLKSALRVTPNDVREFESPPRMKTGPLRDLMLKSFRLCAEAGGELLAIESTGGKELHDDALLNGDLRMAVFALAVLGARDMAQLWDAIGQIGKETGAVAAGDTACGFGNTAMVLAEQGFIPHVWAAVNRVMTVPRSLVAYEHGAVGPSKDCAYEGPYLKAITGMPISMEGAEAACAHSSPVGNIARAVADLWSNESVQNVKLLGGIAPVVSVEHLIYTTRVMNAALVKGRETARMLRDLYVDSDAGRDPQAWVLRPDVVLRISEAITPAGSAYARTCVAARQAIVELRAAVSSGQLSLPPRESKWLDRLARQADSLPDSEEEFIEQMLPQVDEAKVRLEEYDVRV